MDGIILSNQWDAGIEPRQPIDEFPAREGGPQEDALAQHRTEDPAKHKALRRSREEIGISFKQGAKNRASWELKKKTQNKTIFPKKGSKRKP